MNAKHTFTVLTRTAARHPAERSKIEYVLRNQLRNHPTDAVEVAIETGEPMGAALAAVFREAPTLDLAESLRPLIPQRTMALRSLAAEIERVRLEALRRSGAALAREELVERLASLAQRLLDVGRPTEALPLAREALELAKPLYAQYRDAAAELVARAAITASYASRNTGNVMESLAFALRAAAALRSSNLATSAPQLAAAVTHNLSIVLATYGDFGEALTEGRSAVTLYREIASKDRSEQSALAESLCSLAARCVEAGQLAEALAPVDEAVEIFRFFANERPDAFLPRLAAALTIRASVLANLERGSEAVETCNEVVSIYAAVQRGGETAFITETAAAYLNLAASLGAAGRWDDSARVAEIARSRHAVLATGQPDQYVPRVAASLLYQGTALLNLGHAAKAARVLERAAHLLALRFFLTPSAHLEVMVQVLGDYHRSLQAMGAPPPSGLLLRLTGIVGEITMKALKDGEGAHGARRHVAIRLDGFSKPSAVYRYFAEEMFAAVGRFPEDSTLREATASVAEGLVKALGKEGDRASMDSTCEQLAALVRQYPAEQYLQEELVVALHNTITAHAAVPRPDRDRAFARFEEMLEWLRQAPDNSVLREQVASASVTLLPLARDRAEAVELRRRAVELALAHPEQPALRENAAGVIVNELSEFAAPASLSDGHEALTALVELRRRGDTSTLRYYLAAALFNLLNAWLLPRRAWTEAEARCEELAELARTFGDEPRLAEHWCNAVGALAQALVTENEPNRGERVLRSFGTSAPPTRLARQTRALVLGQLALAYALAGRFADAQRYNEELLGLAMRAGGDTLLLERAGRALAGVALLLAHEEDSVGAQHLEERLRALPVAYEAFITAIREFNSVSEE